MTAKINIRATLFAEGEDYTMYRNYVGFSREHLLEMKADILTEDSKDNELVSFIDALLKAEETLG